MNLRQDSISFLVIMKVFPDMCDFLDAFRKEIGFSDHHEETFSWQILWRLSTFHNCGKATVVGLVKQG